MIKKSVNRYPHPRFPTNALFKSSPEMLDLIPKRWQKNILMLSLLTAINATGAGVIRAHAADLSFGYFDPHSCFFEYNATEEEARRIIEEETGKAGITFDLKDSDLSIRTLSSSYSLLSPVNQRVFYPNLIFLRTQLYLPFRTDPLLHTPTTLDETDRMHMIACEYISQEDMETYPYRTMNETTNEIVNILKRDNTGFYYGIFTSCPKETLRMQVRDFINWLKAQGVI